jgi:cysteine-rich repeat protein
MKNNFIKFSFLAIPVFFAVFFTNAAINNMSVIVSVDPVDLGSTSQIHVVISMNPPTFNTWDISIDFDGNGSYEESGVCVINMFTDPPSCSLDFSHRYSAEGDYNVIVQVCNATDNTQCEWGVAIAHVNLPVILCGNGTVDAGESCDDGNTVSGDGCSSTCQIEGGRIRNDLNPLQANTFGELFDSIVAVLFWVAIVLCPLLIIVGGFMIIFAGLDMNKIVLGKKIILYTSVILGIILIVKAMTSFFAPDVTFL